MALTGNRRQVRGWLSTVRAPGYVAVHLWASRASGAACCSGRVRVRLGLSLLLAAGAVSEHPFSGARLGGQCA